MITLVLASVTIGTGPSKSNLDKALDDIERAIRFAADESVVRGSVTRLHFLLEKSPIEYEIQFGPSDAFLLPELRRFDEQSSLGLKDREEMEKILKDVNSQFNKIQEFSEETKKLPEDIRFLGGGTSVRPKMFLEGEFSLYFYPSGERDAGIFLLAEGRQIGYLTVTPFSQSIKRSYELLPDNEFSNIEDMQDEKTKELFEKWLAK